MIKAQTEENFVLLTLSNAAGWNAELLKDLEQSIQTNAPSVIVDCTALANEKPTDETVAALEKMTTLGNVVFIVGEAYDAYNTYEEALWNITPTLNEAKDMLFMISLENELGGDDFEI